MSLVVVIGRRCREASECRGFGCGGNADEEGDGGNGKGSMWEVIYIYSLRYSYRKF